MNYSGSYKRLLANSMAAIVAAIEIYNKPVFNYRDECAVILLMNAWELVLKAVISKQKQSVYYPKKRNQPHRTLSWSDAFSRAVKYAPSHLSLPVRKNLELLSDFRDNTVHFYNKLGFGAVTHDLAQTSILNYRDLVEAVFGVDLAKELNWQVMPIGTRESTDAIAYIAGKSRERKGKSPDAVRQFLSELARAVDEVGASGADASKLLTVYNVQLESVKKVVDADVVVGLGDEQDGPLAIVRKQDPNMTHPFRQKDIVEQMADVHGGLPFTQYTFQAIAWKYKIKEDKRYCWVATEGVLVRYSSEVVRLLRGLSETDIRAALADYALHRKQMRKRR